MHKQRIPAPARAKSLIAFADRLSASSVVRKLVYLSAVAFFITIIFLPPILGIFLKLDRLPEVFASPSLLTRSRTAIAWSFTIAFVVSTLDLVAGLPLAWMIVRSKARLANVVDTLADIPFIVPTVALGFSSVLFWSTSGGISRLFGADPLFSTGLLLVMLLHFAFSFPVIVRVMVGELLGYKETFEIAARTLGAKPLTAVRTVTLPILKPALVAAFLLSFSRSLSETGATVIVAGTFENGPVFIKNARDAGLEGPLVFVSFTLIFASVLVFAVIRWLGPRLKFPVRKVWPGLEGDLSSRQAARARNGLTLFVFMLFVLAPSLYVAAPSVAATVDGTLTATISGTGVWAGFWRSMALSYTIGLIATVVNVLAGFPVAILIARRRLGVMVTGILDSLVNIPIVVPSVALGVSLGFFWRAFGSLPEFWLLVLSHTTITYTYFVRAMSAAIQGISTDLEDAARTLGARPLGVFRKVILPLTKYSVFAGAILAFTRSVDETGAALAVSRELKTAPVLLVDWVRGTVSVSASERALGVALLVLTSFISLLAFRYLVRRR